MAYFTPKTFTFLRALKRHNNRAWFMDHRDRYLADVEAPMLQLIADFPPRPRAISPASVADPTRSRGPILRIYRDTRFSADKTPYKTHAAAQFAHEAKRKVDSVPGFYLHVGPGESFGGGGVYHIDMPALTRIRHRIVDAPKQWAAVKKTGLD